MPHRPWGRSCKNAEGLAGGQPWPGQNDCRAAVQPKRLMRGREPGEAPGKPHADVFLAYATEDEIIAHTIKEQIEAYAAGKDCAVQVTPWGWAPEVGRSVLENIIEKMKGCHFGIFILSPIDNEASGDSSKLKARDNVVLEAGLFIGRKGAQHAFLLLPKGYGVEPSDLAGIIGIQYNYAGGKAKTRGERHAAMWASCEEIVDRIQEVMYETPSQPQSPDSEQPKESGQTLASINPVQVASPLELLSVSLKADAALGNLTRLQDDDVLRGRLVVHGLYGIGQIVAYDPPGQRPRFVTVQFTSSTNMCDIWDLFSAPKNA